MSRLYYYRTTTAHIDMGLLPIYQNPGAQISIFYANKSAGFEAKTFSDRIQVPGYYYDPPIIPVWLLGLIMALIINIKNSPPNFSILDWKSHIRSTIFRVHQWKAARYNKHIVSINQPRQITIMIRLRMPGIEFNYCFPVDLGFLNHIVPRHKMNHLRTKFLCQGFDHDFFIINLRLLQLIRPGALHRFWRT